MRLLLFLCLCLAPVGAEPLSFSIKGWPRQGSPLLVTVKGAEAGSKGALRWGGKSYPLSQADEKGDMRTVLPVPVDMPARAQSLKAVLEGGGEVERSISIQPRNFPVQYLTISAATLASYDDPQNKADDEAILAAQKPFDGEQRWSGHFRVPVQAPESTGFGDRRLYNGWKKGWHKGLDLAAPEGDGIQAPGAGQVVHVARGIVNGNTVVISHGLGLFTIYFHMQGVKVKKGQLVDQGDVIGWVGGTGGFAPHLHWEARVDGVPIDPKSLLELPSGWR